LKNPVLCSAFNQKNYMKYSILVTVFALVSTSAFSQLQVSESTASRNNSTSQFMVAGHKVAINNNSLGFASGISNDINRLTSLSGALNASGVSLYEGSGTPLFTGSYNVQGGDNSVKVYVKPNGGFVVRENIANFLFYDAAGKVKQSISNSSQSTEGESISELAADPAYKTVVLYNPKIVMDGKEGSSAKVLKRNGSTPNIFYSSDRAISLVKVSKDGQFIAIVSVQDGTDGQVDVTDRFGNKLGAFSFNQNIADVKFSTDGEYITIRSASRVGVYSLLSGEREGSTSFRSDLHFAQFVPEDNVIVALTADESGSVLTDIELHTINIEARAIERQEYSGSLGKTDLLSIELERTGANRYTLTGLSKALNLSVSF
jgi:hypothetical protein